MKRMIFKYWIFIFVNILTVNISYAQNINAKNASKSFTLKEAQDYATKNSYKTINANSDIEIAKKKIWQTTSIGLPQINSSGTFNKYFDIPTQLMPDFLTPVIVGVMGGLYQMKPKVPYSPDASGSIPFKMGSDYSMSAGITASQLIFDGSYIVGLQASKVFLELSQNSLKKSESEVKESVAQSYYLVMVAKESIKILDSSIVLVTKTLADIKAMNKSGFVEETDVDQIQMIQINLDNRLNTMTRQLEIANNLLKFQMGLDFGEQITLTDNLDDAVKNAIAENLSSKDLNVKNHIDYKLLETQIKLTELNLRKDRFSYMPSMSCFFTTSRNAMRNEFDFVTSKAPWFATTVFGVNLSVPIFDAGIKHFKIQQDKLELQKFAVTKKQVEQGLKLDVLNAKSSLINITNQFSSDSKNLELAKRVYDKTLIKYKQGVSSSMDLNQAQNQYFQTQGSYFNTILELLKAKSNLNKALNNY